MHMHKKDYDAVQYDCINNNKMILLHVGNLTDITTYLHDCSNVTVSHTLIRQNKPSTKLCKTNMLPVTL